MNRVLIRLYVPSIEEVYDIWIPVNRTIQSAIKLMVKTINEFSNGEYNPTKLPFLYDKKTAKPYNINQTVEEAEIKSGTEIVLI